MQDEGEGESENDEQQVKKEQEQEAAARQKERLDEQARWQEDASSQQQKRIKQQENERSIEFARRTILLEKLVPSDLHTVYPLFVEPEGYKEFEQQIGQSTEQHVLIVAGQEHSGKLMTALYLAQRLCPEKDLDIYLFVNRYNRDLLEIIADEKQPSNAVILFDEIFDTGQIDLYVLTSR